MNWINSVAHAWHNHGDECLLGVEFESGRKEEYDGIFLAYGSATGMEMALKTGLLHEKGAITVDENSIPTCLAFLPQEIAREDLSKFLSQLGKVRLLQSLH